MKRQIQLGALMLTLWTALDAVAQGRASAPIPASGASVSPLGAPGGGVTWLVVGLAIGLVVGYFIGRNAARATSSPA
jgi:hypothetical protein